MVNILLVEDNPADADMFREAIRVCTLEADTTVARDGEQALQMLREVRSTPDFIVLDLNLPRCDGHNFLRKFLPRDHPPIVVFTSSFREQDRVKALELGAKD